MRTQVHMRKSRFANTRACIGLALLRMLGIYVWGTWFGAQHCVWQYDGGSVLSHRHAAHVWCCVLCIIFRKILDAIRSCVPLQPDAVQRQQH